MGLFTWLFPKAAAPDPKLELAKKFLEPGYKLAYALLADAGSFRPFGVGAGPDGKPTCIMPEDGNNATVCGKLREGCNSGRFVVVARFCDAQVQEESGAAPVRAVAVYFDPVGGQSRLILTPFVIEGGKLRCGQPTIRDNPEPLFPDNAKPTEKRLDIHPGEGIGSVRLGMRPAEVLAVFAEPQVYEDWMGGNQNDALLFHGLRFHFTDCDARAPLPNSALNWVVIHQREDAHLFGRPVGEWTKDSVARELQSRGHDVQMPPNGDVEVPGQIGMSFDEQNRVIWVEVYSAEPSAAATRPRD